MRYYSKSAYARHVDVSRQAISIACKEGGALYDALTSSGKIDVSHPACSDYEKNIKRVEKKTDQLPSLNFDEVFPDELLKMPFGDVILRFGTKDELKEYVNIVKALVQTQGYAEDQARKRKEFIHVDHVKRLVGYLEGMQKMLLTDAVKNMANKVSAQIKSGADSAEIERGMHDVISKTIVSAKDRLIRDLSNV